MILLSFAQPFLKLTTRRTERLGAGSPSGGPLGLVRVEVLTMPVEFHECFEYSQVEFFDGDVHMLGELRAKRLQSFANNSATPPEDNFTSTAKIVADAKSKSKPNGLELPRNVSSLTREGPLSPKRKPRLLNHWLCLLGAARDLDLSLQGTGCGRQVTPTC